MGFSNDQSNDSSRSPEKKDSGKNPYPEDRSPSLDSPSESPSSPSDSDPSTPSPTDSTPSTRISQPTDPTSFDESSIPTSPAINSTASDHSDKLASDGIIPSKIHPTPPEGNAEGVVSETPTLKGASSLSDTSTLPMTNAISTPQHSDSSPIIIDPERDKPGETPEGLEPENFDEERKLSETRREGKNDSPQKDGDAPLPNDSPSKTGEPDPVEIRMNENVDPKEQRAAGQVNKVGTLEIGSKLAHFTINKYIGGGGMGRVYEATDEMLDRKVAIKILPQQRAQDQASLARFMNEAKLAARLNHKNIAQVYFCGREDNLHFIAFEYVKGVNLRNYITQNGVLSLKEAIRFLDQISSALAHASSHGVTHRDVKPSNIIITPQNEAKLIDMGLARLLRPSDPEDELTVSGVTLGTYDYISPEQAMDPRSADVRSDIYSLGCTFFFMLTGQPPFPEGTVLQKLLKHQGDQPPDIRQFVPETPAEIVAIIQKMMAKTPSDRYQNPDELIADLKEATKRLGYSTGSAEVLPMEKSSWTGITLLLRHLPWVSAVFLLLLLVTGSYFFSRNESKSPLIPYPKPEIWRPDRPGPSPLPDPGTLGEGKDWSPESSPLPLRLLPPVDRIHEMVPDFSNGTSASFLTIPRISGGLGTVNLQSNDIPNAADLQELSPELLRMIGLTVAPEMDTFSDSWSPFRRLNVTFHPSPVDSLFLSDGTDLIVDGVGRKMGHFATLTDVVAYIDESIRKNEEMGEEPKEFVVRVAVDGDLDISPLKFVHEKVILTAAGGFAPRLLFHPRERNERIPLSAMFTLENSQLTIKNLSIFLDITDQEIISTEWSVATLDHHSSLSVEDSLLTIRNQKEETEPLSTPDSKRGELYHSDVAFFRSEFPIGSASAVSAPFISERLDFEENDGSDVSRENPTSGERADSRSLLFTPPGEDLPAVRIVGSLIRGEATLFALQSIPKGRLELSASAIVTAGPLCSYEDYSPAAAPESVHFDVTFDRVIVIAHSPLLREVRKASSFPAKWDDFQLSVSCSLLDLLDQPVGVQMNNAPLLSQEEEPFELDWSWKESLLLNIPLLGRSESIGSGGVENEIPISPIPVRRMEKFSSEWNDFVAIPPRNVTLGDLDYHLLRPLKKSPELESWEPTISTLENELLLPLENLFGDSVRKRSNQD